MKNRTKEVLVRAWRVIESLFALYVIGACITLPFRFGWERPVAELPLKELLYLILLVIVVLEVQIEKLK
jgi:hypothetical protein